MLILQEPKNRIFLKLISLIQKFALEAFLRLKQSAQKCAGKFWDYPAEMFKSLKRFKHAALRANFAIAKFGINTKTDRIEKELGTVKNAVMDVGGITKQHEQRITKLEEKVLT